MEEEGNVLVVTKLYSRPIDLAQFKEEDAPLYPMCRSWIQGQKQNKVQKEKTSSSPDLELDEDQYESIPPISKQDILSRLDLDPEEGDVDLRIPKSVRNFKPAEDLQEKLDRTIYSMRRQDCINLNKERWRKVRSEWAEARKIHEARYETSFKTIQDLFMCPQKQ